MFSCFVIYLLHTEIIAIFSLSFLATEHGTAYPNNSQIPFTSSNS